MNGPIQERIRAALPEPAEGDFAAAAIDLLAVLGYRSSRAIAGQSGNPAEFFRQFYAPNPDTKSEGDFLGEAESVHLLFQLTNAEIAGTEQAGLFEADRFDTGNAQSFLFAAVALGGQTYPRGRYAAFTRELNKRLIHPMVVLFRTAAGKISLAFVHRRRNRQHPERAVLGPVSLLREINPVQPHRAHLDILADLALPQRRRWLESHGHSPNFDGLLSAWLDALDTEELNRRFYRDLFAWFEGAVQTARFPAGLAAEEQVIRLITRMLFCWFIKEKGLAAEELFIEHQVRGLLKDYDRESGDSYYRAILQNLFFATLNTEIERRQFSGGGQATHRDFSRYRYAAEIAAPERLLELFSQTPFINGGLFDCLDSEAAASQGGQRIDCFTDNVINPRRAEYGLLSLPNRLFFGDAAVPGLLDLFHRYQFTVEENTPAEQEVALDPELLGKVFENLLAAVNPETRQTARKETGSYYTPRPVVDYMATAALVNALAGQVAANAGPAAAAANTAPANAANAAATWQNRLHWLLDYNDAFADAESLFTPAEREALIRAIAGLKVLDPAVGSGAFPMGILHQLTLALRRLDPDNALWEGIQKEIAGQQAAAAFDTPDPTARNDRLAAVSATFDRYRNSDYGRKLYLIQNGIYGVDLQPLAVQIAKLRFFISLAIEQQPRADRTQNYGIAPLPNLETRFVAADALRGLGGLHRELVSPAAAQGQRRLAENRERHFHAANRRDKLACRREDARLRRQLAAQLRKVGLPAGPADRIARWDPYNPSAAADWFDPGYMFGVEGGFDVVLGNPPYVATKDKQLRELYQEGIYGRANTYGLFIQRGLQLTSVAGQLTYINPRTLLTDRYFTNLRKVIKAKAELKGIVLIADRHNTFENVLQECIILHLAEKAGNTGPYIVNTGAIARPEDLNNPQNRLSIGSERVLLGDDYDGAFYIGASEFEYQVFERMNAVGVKLADFGLKAETGKMQFDKYQRYAQATNARGAGRLIWAENIQRYAWRESRKRIGKEWLGRGIIPIVPPNITGTGIVTQRVSANEQPRRIIATLINPESVSAASVYSENHTNFIALGRGKHPAFVLGVLNSSLMEFAFRRLNSNTQVSAGELNSLPFPPLPAGKTLKEIEDLVSELLALGGVDSPAERAQEAIAKERRLDILIGSLYGFSAAEVAQVQGMLPAYETVYGIGTG